jgi:hypothetical protein
MIERVFRYFDKSSDISRGISFIGLVWIVISFVHFGIYFYDLDKLLTNLMIGIGIIFAGYVVNYFKKNVEEEIVNDIKMIDKNSNQRFDNIEKRLEELEGRKV